MDELSNWDEVKKKGKTVTLNGVTFRIGRQKDLENNLYIYFTLNVRFIQFVIIYHLYATFSYIVYTTADYNGNTYVSI